MTEQFRSRIEKIKKAHELKVEVAREQGRAFEEGWTSAKRTIQAVMEEAMANIEGSKWLERENDLIFCVAVLQSGPCITYRPDRVAQHVAAMTNSNGMEKTSYYSIADVSSVESVERQMIDFLQSILT